MFLTDLGELVDLHVEYFDGIDENPLATVAIYTNKCLALPERYPDGIEFESDVFKAYLQDDDFRVLPIDLNEVEEDVH